ncbi:Gfo/Idh/MocA family oxidoreductase [Christensenellaceae bacterium OttesenSCG-928-K19]|nr:Gfo/Idh/MocA family oxidoreductase [Christensenellaceae bacterium OttesenSCG-928-K19]
MGKFKWAIVSTGYIAHRFVQGARLLPQADIVAVSSRTMESAKKFADEYGIAGRYDDYGKMLAEAKPDIVYVATPNIVHYAYVMQALERGIHVLCEKPMADNLTQMNEMYAKAAEADLFLMEGMWTRCFPAVRKAIDWIRSGKIGRVNHVRSEFSFKPEDGHWQPWKAEAALGGGAIRDLGIYTLSMAFLGIPEEPLSITSTCVPYRGADLHSEFFLEFADNRTAFLRNGMDTMAGLETVICGDEGQIKIGRVFFCPDRAILYRNEEGGGFGYVEQEVFDEPYEATGFQYEAQHVMDRISAGETTSDWFPPMESRKICRITDEFRRKWGIRYTTDPEGWWTD